VRLTARSSPFPAQPAAPLPAAPALAEVARDLHEEVRRCFPALERDADGGERLYLNSGGGTLVAESSARALARAAQYANPQDGGVSPGEMHTAAIHARARADAAAFLNAPSPDDISFHLSTTHALFNLSFALRDVLRRGDNLVVTHLDHSANVSPWESLWGEDRGLTVRQCRLRPDGTLDLNHLRRLVDRRTRVVAVTHASNGLGSVVPVAEVARIAHRHEVPQPPLRTRRGSWSGALLVVDAVHHAYHGPIDVQALGCDFLAFSGYKLFGPMIGVLWGRREWLEALRPYRVEANQDRVPVKYEQGTLNNASLAGLSGAFEYLRWLGEKVESAAAERSGARALAERLRQEYPRGDRQRFKWAMCGIHEYEKTLSAALLQGFRRLAGRGVKVIGIKDPARLEEREPTFLFEVRGRRPEDVKRQMWEEGRIELPGGHNYSVAVYRALRNARALRASFAHYDNPAAVRRFLNTLTRIAAS
jgi:cysteine desulfurase family protein (TIGR01976 family)